MKRIVARAAILSLVLQATVATAQAIEDPDSHLVADLVASTTGVQPGGTVWVALRQRIDPGWHTYWRNPGEGGQATRLVWSMPPGWTADPMLWPTPERTQVGPLTNYVHSGDVIMPIRLHVPADARAGTTTTLRASATFLLCKDVCIPERRDLSLRLPVRGDAPPADPRDGAAIDAAVARIVRRPSLDGSYTRSDRTIAIALTGSVAGSGDAYLYPETAGLLDPGAPQAVSRVDGGLVVRGSRSSEGPEVDGPVAGVLAFADGRSYDVALRPGPLPPWASGAAAGAAVATAEDFGTTVAGAAVLAFLGGLILNLMPCVFPILSMKAAALARHGADPRRARVDGVAFLAGSLVAFAALGSVLVAMQAAGARIGWGFQLQSPTVVAVLALIMLLSGLNLAGVFEAGLSLQGIQAPARARSGWIGAFSTGALAAVVAAPCTAPLMGPAIGWGLTQAPAVALFVLCALGFGLALPFVVLSFVPRFVRAIPRPGPWLGHFKQAMAFPMFGAAAWLAWVLASQTGSAGLPGLFGAALAIAIAAWAWGMAQRGGHVVAWRATALVGAVILAPMGVTAAVGMQGDPARHEAAIPLQPWSIERVAALRAEGHPVFVDFTAAWCVTCVVNERVALSNADVVSAFEHTRTTYLKADWTNADPRIADELTAHRRSGVPLYLVYSKTGEPRVLPQILTPDVVIAALTAAASDNAQATKAAIDGASRLAAAAGDRTAQ